MRFDPPPKIAAAELWLPPAREQVADALLAGRIEPKRARGNGYTELAVSDDPPPRMAIRAGERALDSAGISRDEVGLLVHSWSWYQGQDYWDPVHYIINELRLTRAIPLGISLGCNGGFAAVEAAACRMACDAGVRTAVLTTAERFCLPRFDRWQANLNVSYGDSGTALVIDAERGQFEVLSTATVTDARFEGMYRGSAPWNNGPFERAEQVDIQSQLRNFMASGHGPELTAAATQAVTGTVTSALALAGIAPDDPRIRVVAPLRLGAEEIERSYVSVLTGLTKAEILNLGRQTGHLGAGDLAANLADIARARMLEPGQVALMLSAIVGFTWSCMVVRAS